MLGWHLAGDRPERYVFAIDRRARVDGQRVAQLRSVGDDDPGGFGTLMQTIAADVYRGQRVRFSGLVRADEVAGWAGLWLRVDGPHGSAPLAFDNMRERPISGTTAWTRHQVVLDVPNAAQAIAFGVLLAGRGSVHITGLGFEIVSSDIPTTDTPPRPNQPQNLDFAAD